MLHSELSEKIIGAAMRVLNELKPGLDDNNRETIFMNQNVNELIKARVRQWNKASTVLQDVRNHDIQHADTARAMHCFTGAVLAALPKHPPLPWSGLVEQQKIFRKVRVL